MFGPSQQPGVETVLRVVIEFGVVTVSHSTGLGKTHIGLPALVLKLCKSQFIISEPFRASKTFLGNIPRIRQAHVDLRVRVVIPRKNHGRE